MSIFKPLDFYILHKQALSFENLFSLNETCPNLPQTEAFLREVFVDDSLQCILLQESEHLYNQLQKWLNHEAISDPVDFLQTLFKYYLRACGHTQNRGVFTSYALGKWENKTSIQIGTSDNRILLNINTLYSLSALLVNDESIKKQVRFFPNNSIYRVVNRCKYLFTNIQNGIRNFEICSVDFSEHIQQTLKLAKRGCFIDELAVALKDDEITDEEATDFIHQLINEQILVSELEPSPTDSKPLQTLIQKLSNIRIDVHISYLLRRISYLIEKSNPNTHDIEEIRSILANFSASLETNSFQFSPLLNTHINTIKREISEDLSRKISRLLALNHGDTSLHLESFKTRFTARFKDTEISLSDALDDDLGVGYTNFTTNKPLIEDFAPQINDFQNIRWAYWKQFTINKLFEATRNQDFEIKLSDKDLDNLEKNQYKNLPNLPPTFCASGILFHKTDDSYVFQLKDISGTTALHQLGDLRGIEHLVRECANHEAILNPDIIYAQIVPVASYTAQKPQTKYRTFEILYPFSTNENTDNQLFIDDLLISITTEKEIILRSKKHNKRVVPKFSYLPTTTTELGIYAFLSDLEATTECINIGWHWHLLSHQPFLPRVSYQNIILSPATWNIKPKDFEHEKIDIPKILEIKKQLRMPRFVVFSEGENDIFIDFEHPLCLDLVVSFWKKYQLLTFKEVLFDTSKALIKTTHQSFNNHLTIPFKNIDYKVLTTKINDIFLEKQPSFFVGSEWLYLKLYCSPHTADEILGLSIKPLVESLYHQKVITSFFFSREQSPESFIGLYFAGNPEQLFYAAVIQQAQLALQTYLKTGLVYGIKTDIYHQNSDKIGVKSSIFEQIKSEITLSNLNFIETNPDIETRFRYACLCLESYFNDFKIEPIIYLEFVETTLQVLSKKHNISSIMSQFQSSYGIQSNSVIDKKNTSNLKKYADIVLEKHLPQSSLFNFLGLLMNFSINQIFISDSIFYECILYGFVRENRI